MKKIFAILLAGMTVAAVVGEEQKTERQILQEQQSAQQALTQEKIEESADKDAKILYYAGKVLFYVPNVIVDAVDTFSVTVKAGPSIGAGFHVTRALGLGAEVGTTFGIYKEVNRQYGFALENGYQAQFIFLTAENISVLDPIGSVKEYWQVGNDFPSCFDGIYNFTSGSRDYWAIDTYLSAFIGARVAIHPIEIADFLTGLFFYDLKGDDIQLSIY